MTDAEYFGLLYKLAKAEQDGEDMLAEIYRRIHEQITAEQVRRRFDQADNKQTN